MKESTFKYVIKDTFNHNKILATIKPHRLLITSQRFSILDARGYSTTENERYRVDRYINNEYIYTSLLLTEEEEEPTLEEPEYDNLDDLEEEDTKARTLKRLGRRQGKGVAMLPLTLNKKGKT